MNTLQNEFNLPVGYSDHTTGIEISVAAVALGATVIEKHLTLDRNMKGPDHAASLEPDEFTKMVTSIRHIEDALGNGEKKVANSEIPVRMLVRRSVTVLHDLGKGDVIKQEDIGLLRPGNGIQPMEIDSVIGKKTNKTILAGSTLHWSDLMP